MLLTHSSMSCFKSCPRRFRFRYIDGVQRDRTSEPLRFGSAFHQGLHVLRESGLDTAVEAVRANYAEIPEWVAHEEDGIENWLVECETVIRLICAYQWAWQNDGIQVVVSEKEFRREIEGAQGWSTGGKIDVIVKLPDGRLALQETKTTREDISDTADYWERLRLDSQISGYVLAARQMGYNVETVLYDVIRKPMIRPRKLTKAELAEISQNGIYAGEQFNKASVERETPGMFGARLSSEIAAEPARYFQRREIPRLAADIEEYESELKQIQRSISVAARYGRWYRNTDSCMNIKGGRCEYLEVCRNGIDPSKSIPTGFVQLTWTHPELTERFNDEQQPRATETSVSPTVAESTPAKDYIF